MKKMVEMFQCPGCVCGSGTNCGKYSYEEDYRRCTSHVLGTSAGIGNRFALGLPKGFNKPGFNQDGEVKQKISVRLHKEGTYYGWDNLNIPVWAMEESGFLFVRTVAPRIGKIWVDVIENGTIEMCPNAINPLNFYDDID